MSDYIKRERALDMIESARTWKWSENQLYDVVKALKAENVRPAVNGHWIINTDDFTPKKRCSVCGYNKPIPAGERLKKIPENFCPNCGADMRGGQKE